jgi:DNA-binding XRE family transcriptional regulator
MRSWGGGGRYWAGADPWRPTQPPIIKRQNELLRARGMAVSEHDKALIARTRELRKALGWSQQEMADALNIPGARYRTYERRGPLPYDLLKPFAELTGARYRVFGNGGARWASAKRWSAEEDYRQRTA